MRYTIEHLPLLPGRYVVSVSAYDHHLVEPLDHRERVTTFTVTEGGTLERFGKVTLGGTWRCCRRPRGSPSRRERPGIAVVLHGAHWPAGDPAARGANASHRDRRVVDVVLARDEPTRPQGAARVLADALGRTLGHRARRRQHAPYDDAGWRAAAESGVRREAERPAVARVAHAAHARDRPADDLIAARRRTSMHPADVGDNPGCWASPGRVDRRRWTRRALLVRRRGRAIWRRGSRAPGTARCCPVPMRRPPPTVTRCSGRPTVAGMANALGCVVRTARRGARSGLSCGHSGLPAPAAWRGTGLRRRRLRSAGLGSCVIGRRDCARVSVDAPPDDAWPADEAATACRWRRCMAFPRELPELIGRARGGLRRSRRRPRRPLQHAAAAAPPATRAATRRPRVSVIVVNWNGRSTSSRASPRCSPATTLPTCST